MARLEHLEKVLPRDQKPLRLLTLRDARAGVGLGEMGILSSFLCEDCGQRTYLGAVITSTELIPDRKQKEELCKGEDCGLWRLVQWGILVARVPKITCCACLMPCRSG